MGLFGFKYRLQPDRVTSQNGVQDAVMLIGTWGILYGLSLISQPNKLWMLAYYDTARLVPGSPDTWGYASLIGGACIFVGMYVGKNKVLITGTLIIVLWNLFFAYSFAREAIRQDDVSFSPAITYAVIGIWAATHCVNYRKRNLENAV